MVARREEVWLVVELGNDVVWRLADEMRESLHERAGHLKRFFEFGGNSPLLRWDMRAILRDEGIGGSLSVGRGFGGL
jgi:hypothetical protein